jgi:hypothetical protein
MSSTSATAAGGPKSPEGKAISSRNAIRHGLTSVSPLLPSEDPAEFEAFQSNVVTQYDPQDAEDTVIVLAYVDTLWRLRRVPAQESRLITIEVLRMKLAAKDDPALAQFMLLSANPTPSPSKPWHSTASLPRKRYSTCTVRNSASTTS